MMEPTDLFTVALGLQSPWKVEDIRFEPEAGDIHFDVACAANQLGCPVRGEADQPVHDRKKRSWQHLHFFQYKALIHTRSPRITCGGGGETTQVKVPWANERSGFTLQFEALAITLAKHMPIRHVAELLGVADCRLWNLLYRIVSEARKQEGYQGVRYIGIDEKSDGRLGYITLFHDLDQRRVLFVTEGRDQTVFTPFVEDFQANGGEPDKIRAVSMDISKAFQAGSRKQLPKASFCFDAFHLIKLGNEAMEAVRREEGKQESDLKGMRWGILKDSRQWTRKQINEMHWLQRSGLKRASAWRMKERPREILHQARSGVEPSELLRRWVSWARRSQLVHFKRLGTTIRDHMEGIINSYKYQLSNGTAVSINSKIKAAIARTRGFRTHRNLYSIIYLVAGKLTHIPASPYQQTTGAD